ncbi:ras-like GTPase, Rho2 subfamily [Bisporella sp. PMI_857]|nr:ras-like GTPase, Rho2 subfamily [Bisporella sp. PMI_857]
MAIIHTRKAIQRKLVIIGDSGCGKTTLLRVALGELSTNPGYVESYARNESDDGTLVRLILWDTAGAFDYGRLEPLKYVKAHILLIGFHIDSTDSLCNVEENWKREATLMCPKIPIILVGLKKDLRDSHIANEGITRRGMGLVTTTSGEAVAQKIGACKYLECSSLTGEGVGEVFEAAAQATLLELRKEKRDMRCVVL